MGKDLDILNTEGLSNLLSTSGEEILGLMRAYAIPDIVQRTVNTPLVTFLGRILISHTCHTVKTSDRRYRHLEDDCKLGSM